MADNRSLIAAYFKQQSELGMPDIVFSPEFDIQSILTPSPRFPVFPKFAGTSTAKAPTAKYSAPLPGSPSRPRPAVAHNRAGQPVPNEVPSPVGEPTPSYGPSDGGTKRVLLAALYKETRSCVKCPLGSSRTNYVFGAGNAEAPLLIIGEAPGADEDQQGLPFVGAAGQLLTKMLAAIHLDRTRDVFITNVLKCRPPQNRTPELAETTLCAGILERQIEIIAPRMILLLGRIAAQAVLNKNEGIGVLRTGMHDYKGIPVVVTYHPAALLRNADYKRPAWEDLQKIEAILKNSH